MGELSALLGLLLDELEYTVVFLRFLAGLLFVLDLVRH
jgi:hypothetical protein